MSKTCDITAGIYEDMPFCPGQKSLPGIRPYIYVARKTDIVSFPKPQGIASGKIADIAVIKDAFVFAQSKGFVKVDIVPNDGHPQSESQGEYGAKSFLNTLAFNIPGSKEAATGFVTAANNDDLVIIYVEKDGQCRLHGNEGDIAQFAISQDGGQGATDANQTGVTSTVNSEYPHPFITSKFPLDGGNVEVDGATGVESTKE